MLVFTALANSSPHHVKLANFLNYPMFLNRLQAIVYRILYHVSSVGHPTPKVALFVSLVVGINGILGHCTLRSALNCLVFADSDRFALDR